MKVLVVSAERRDYLVLFRIYVSRKATGKGIAVLEGVELDAATIHACFMNNPLNEEEAVQDGLIRWCEGKGYQPPTWRVLIEAMEYARFAQQNMQDLVDKLGTLFVCVDACMHVCVVRVLYTCRYVLAGAPLCLTVGTYIT